MDEKACGGNMTNDDLEKYLSDENEEWGIDDFIRKYSRPGDDKLIRKRISARGRMMTHSGI